MDAHPERQTDQRHKLWRAPLGTDSKRQIGRAQIAIKNRFFSETFKWEALATLDREGSRSACQCRRRLRPRYLNAGNRLSQVHTDLVPL